MDLLEVPVPIIWFSSLWPPCESGTFRFPYAQSTPPVPSVKRKSSPLDDAQENPGND